MGFYWGEPWTVGDGMLDLMRGPGLGLEMDGGNIRAVVVG
jgi:hypothetical protein